MDPFLKGSDRGGDSAGVVEQTSGKVRVRRDRVNRVTKVLQHVTDVEVMGAVTLFNQPRQNESTEYLNSANEFLNSVNKSTLDDFKTLQERARLSHEQGGEARGATALGKASSVEPERNMGEEGYCIREFRRFLKTIDAKDEWCGLSAKISDDGDVFFACKECCKKTPIA